MKLIVGLGNPGPKYAGTRHNVGFEVVDELARRHRITMDVEKFHGWFGRGAISDQAVVLLKPTTYVNRSGQAVHAAGRFFQMEALDLLVVSDDLALPLGQLRMRAGGSSGGHNGLQDIVDRLGTDQWARLRIGIGAAVGDPASFVLTRFGPDETAVVERAIGRGSDAVECWLAQGVEMTMNRFNGTGSSE